MQHDLQLLDLCDVRRSEPPKLMRRWCDMLRVSLVRPSRSPSGDLGLISGHVQSCSGIKKTGSGCEAVFLKVSGAAGAAEAVFLKLAKPVFLKLAPAGQQKRASVHRRLSEIVISGNLADMDGVATTSSSGNTT